MEYAIGIDLGSTNFRVGVVSSDGVLHEKYMEEVGANRDAEDIAHFLFLHIKRLLEAWPDVIGVGIGIPGIVNKEKGIVHQAPHYPKWHDVKFKELLNEQFNVPVIIDNDANMIALGEGMLGAAKDLDNFLMITLGTGVGGGLFLNGKILHGDTGFAGEIGHMIVEFDGPPCNCGGRGCWEMYVSATGLKHMVEISDEPHKDKFLKSINDDYHKVTPALLFDHARDGDIFASVIWKKFGTYLGVGIASLVNTFGVFNIVIGGGVSKAWDYFIKPAENELKKRTYKHTGNLVKLHPAVLEHDAGVFGSARAVLQPECD